MKKIIFISFIVVFLVTGSALDAQTQLKNNVKQKAPITAKKKQQTRATTKKMTIKKIQTVKKSVPVKDAKTNTMPPIFNDEPKETITPKPQPIIINPQESAPLPSSTNEILPQEQKPQEDTKEKLRKLRETLKDIKKIEPIKIKPIEPITPIAPIKPSSPFTDSYEGQDSSMRDYYREHPGAIMGPPLLRYDLPSF